MVKKIVWDKSRHYVLKANRGNFWHNLYPSVIEGYVSEFGDNFSVVLYRESGEFYAIPWSVLKSSLHEFTLNYYSNPRWLATINKDGYYVLSLGDDEPSQFVGDMSAYRNVMPTTTIRLMVSGAELVITETATGVEVVYDNRKVIFGKYNLCA